jgi:hypothetical protein
VARRIEDEVAAAQRKLVHTRFADGNRTPRHPRVERRQSAAIVDDRDGAPCIGEGELTDAGRARKRTE